MKKKLIKILIVVLAFSIFATSCTTTKYQYLPGRNTKVVGGLITEQWTTVRGKATFHWFKMNYITMHVWAKDLDSNMKVGKHYDFVGTWPMSTGYDKNRKKDIVQKIK